jgi:hypothetical protein
MGQLASISGGSTGTSIPNMGSGGGLGGYLMPARTQQYLPAVGAGAPQVGPGTWVPPRTAVPGLTPQSAIPGTTWKAATQNGFVGNTAPQAGPYNPTAGLYDPVMSPTIRSISDLLRSRITDPVDYLNSVSPIRRAALSPQPTTTPSYSSWGGW